ncbi:MAG: hypothetical protein V1822_03805 [Candidatus Micrarchaeota archaeon]
MKIQFFAISLLLLISLLAAQTPSSMQLVSPINQKQIYSDSVEFHFLYNKGDSGPVQTACILSIDGSPIATISAQFNQDVFYTSTSIPSGIHSWSVECNGESSQNETFERQPQAASVELIFPKNGTLTKDSGMEFNFTYHAADEGNGTAQCYLNIGYTQLGPLSLPSEQEGTIEITDLPRRIYEWYVTCDQFKSAIYTLEAQATVAPAVEPVSPQVGAVFNTTNPSFDFIYDAGTEGPQQAECNLIIYPFREGSISAISGERTSITAHNISAGKQLWYVECNRGIGSYVTTGEAREFIISSNASSSIGEENNSAQNQSLNSTAPPATAQAVLIAPPRANTGESIQLKLLDKNGQPISGAQIKIIPSSGQPQVLTTGQNGTVSFSSGSPMSFSYQVEGYELAQSPFTNVVYEPAQAEQNSTPAQGGAQNPPSQPPASAPSEGTGILYAIVAAILIVLAIGAYFAFAKKPSKKEKGASEKAEDINRPSDNKKAQGAQKPNSKSGVK